jgi:chromosome segregation ATPase
LTKENLELQEDIKELQQQLSKEKQLKDALQQTKECLKSENEHLKAQLSGEIESNLSPLNSLTTASTMFQLQSEIQHFNKRQEEEYIQEIQVLKEKSESLSKENEKLQRQLSDLNNLDHNRIAAKLEETTKLLLESQKNYSEQLQEIKEELKRKQFEIVSFQDTQKRLHETIHQLNVEIGQKQTLISSLQQDLYEKIKVISQLQHETTQLKLLLEQKNGELLNITEKLKKKDEELEYLSSQLTLVRTELTKEQQKYQEEIEKIKSQLESKEQLIFSLQEEVTNLTEMLQHNQDSFLHDQLSQLETINMDIQHEIKLRVAEEENLRLIESNKNLQMTLDKEISTKKKLTDQLNIQTEGNHT